MSSKRKKKPRRPRKTPGPSAPRNQIQQSNQQPNQQPAYNPELSSAGASQGYNGYGYTRRYHQIPVQTVYVPQVIYVVRPKPTNIYNNEVIHGYTKNFTRNVKAVGLIVLQFIFSMVAIAVLLTTLASQVVVFYNNHTDVDDYYGDTNTYLVIVSICVGVALFAPIVCLFGSVLGILGTCNTVQSQRLDKYNKLVQTTRLIFWYRTLVIIEVVIFMITLMPLLGVAIWGVFLYGLGIPLIFVVGFTIFGIIGVNIPCTVLAKKSLKFYEVQSKTTYDYNQPLQNV